MDSVYVVNDYLQSGDVDIGTLAIIFIAALALGFSNGAGGKATN